MQASTQSTYVPLLWRMMHFLKLRLDEKLAPYDITSRQARLLGWVAASQSQDRTLRQKDLEQLMGLRAPSVTSLVQGLEKNGFITRTCDDDDARTKKLSLTPKAAELRTVFDEIFQTAEEAVVTGMTKGQRQMFLELLQIALHNLESNASFCLDSNHLI